MTAPFLEDIDVLSMDVCTQDNEKYIAETRATADLTAVLPYLNAMFQRAVYNPNSNSIKFTYERVDFTISGDRINLQKFRSRTELMELLDWIRDVVNDTYASMAELTPLYKTRKIPTALALYALLPKTNCRKCGEKSCMAFAARLNKMELEPGGCPPLNEPDYAANRIRLEKAFDSYVE
jgi:ArsR family metal-binding transcriptional regulator